MTTKKTLVLAITGAIAVEAILWVVYLLFGHFGGDGPDSVGCVFLYSHIGGFTVADKILRLPSPADAVCIVISGLMQWFITFWFVLLAVRTIRVKMKAEQSAAPLPPAPAGPSEGAR